MDLFLETQEARIERLSQRKPISKESAFELQLIDCNCTDCVFMIRDLDKFKVWEHWSRNLQLVDFERSKAKDIVDANWVIDNAIDENMLKSGQGMLRKANKRSFQFSRMGLFNFGVCDKFKKEVNFIQGICQINTQSCFSHRKLV